MKPDHKLFFAIPFDSATKSLYQRVTRAIRKRYPGVTTVIGSEEVGPSQRYSDIASFKAQNRELTRQFVAQIQDADIVVADLTHNNPNVHVELGIALMQNKNILRVTGRSISELGFDIRNLAAYQYGNEAQLKTRIASYLDTFLRIKQLPISKEFASLYAEEPSKIELRALPPKEFVAQSNLPSNFLMRDGAVQVEFEILKAATPMDWFGVYFRVGPHPFIDSHLVYIRQNGSLEVAIYPGPIVLKTVTGQPISGKQKLTIEFENNYLDAQIGMTRLQTDALSYQAIGRVLPAAYCADTDVCSVRMICRDTIDRSVTYSVV
jgi:nucleoside 2-deoxyribosyltransferase